ncbi:BfmA/BtgA family mobilization protein [Aquimarina sp. AU119]|uniref:BfmA/BtgA family mobilization protein n=1 Tax=Aquimarina sp. AU119 TaxID=2108528 RepID=UPI00351A4EDD
MTQIDYFKTVRIKKKTLLRFKSFSRKVSSSYSKTLDMVIHFFEWQGNGINEYWIRQSFMPSLFRGKFYGFTLMQKLIKS